MLAAFDFDDITAVYSPILKGKSQIQGNAPPDRAANAKEREKLVLDWRKQQTTRAMVFTTVKEVLDQLPRTYTQELYDQKCDLVYQHFYEGYMGQGQSVYGPN